MPTTSGIIAMRAHVSAIGTLTLIVRLVGGLAMQLCVNSFGQLT